MAIYSEPISVTFGQERLLLDPAVVDFHVDVDQMLGEAAHFLEGSDFLDIARARRLAFTNSIATSPPVSCGERAAARVGSVPVARSQLRAPGLAFFRQWSVGM